MNDTKYCYAKSNVLKNKFNKENPVELFNLEKDYTASRLYDLQDKPIKGKFDLNHLKKIHKYIFKDVYDWAGELRTVEIGKGNMFCMVQNLQSYASSIFDEFYSDCSAAKNDIDKFIRVFTKHYADLNALHPFREGNGRTQREFARELCLKCGYDFDLSPVTHKEILNASIISFNKGNNKPLEDVFKKAITVYDKHREYEDRIKILTSDDLSILPDEEYKYFKDKKKKEQKMYETTKERCP